MHLMLCVVCRSMMYIRPTVHVYAHLSTRHTLCARTRPDPRHHWRCLLRGGCGHGNAACVRSDRQFGCNFPHVCIFVPYGVIMHLWLVWTPNYRAQPRRREISTNRCAQWPSNNRSWLLSRSFIYKQCCVVVLICI